MHSKTNRTFKLKKPLNSSKQEQPLKGQTTKLQDKLQTLKAEIAMRKTMKNSAEPAMKTTQKNSTGGAWGNYSKSSMSKTTTHADKEQVNRFLLGAGRAQDKADTRDQEQLLKLLQDLGMEQHSEALMNRHGVTGLSKLLQLKQQDIDMWKEVPVGYRIKVRKFLAQHAQTQQQQQAEVGQSENEVDIEAIIKRRKEEKIYEPIHDKQQEEYEDQDDYHQEQQQQLQEQDEQEVLISSLNNAFFQHKRRGIIKKHAPTRFRPSPPRVHWDKSVKQFNRETSTFRGEQSMTKYPAPQLIHSLKQEIRGLDSGATSQPAFCWSCLRKIAPVATRDGDKEPRSFCGAKCRDSYLKMVELPQPAQAELAEEVQLIDLDLM